jgi:hypothetical protein
MGVNCAAAMSATCLFGGVRGARRPHLHLVAMAMAMAALGRGSLMEEEQTYDGMEWFRECERSQPNRTSCSEERLRGGGLVYNEIAFGAGLLRGVGGEL